jgi:hypothetical protein
MDMKPKQPKPDLRDLLREVLAGTREESAPNESDGGGKPQTKTQRQPNQP